MKSLVKSVIACAVIFMLGSALCHIKAEPLEFIYEHYTSDEGLPHNSICDIHQDQRGYLWLCTWYGLSRYDGSSFVNYTMTPGDTSNLSHNRIISIDEDADGRLWVMTYDNRLYRFDVDDEEFIAIPSGLEGLDGLDLPVECLHCSGDGSTWVALAGAGLVRVCDDLEFTMYFNSIGEEITSIHEDSAGNIYVVSEYGISMITDGSSSLLARAPEAFDFAETAEYLLFTAPDQLIIVDKATREQRKIDLNSLGVSDATAMTVSGGTVYVGFRDNSVASVNPDNDETRLHRCDMGRVRYLYPDPDGFVWIATDRTGIWSYDLTEDRFRHYEHSNNVMSYYTDTLARVETKGDRTWVKMNNWGFGYYDRCCDEIVPLSNVKEQEDYRFMNGVACFEVDSTGVLWMSTIGRGLERVMVIAPSVDIIAPPTRYADELSSSEIRAMLRDRKGNLWVAAKSCELYRYSPDMKSCMRLPDGKDYGVVYSIFEDRDGNIWLGTKGNGLIRLRQDGNGYAVKTFLSDPSDRNSLSSDNVYSVTQDHDGRIWVGTYGGGLSMLPDPDSDEFITVRNNFPDYPQEAGSRVRYLHCMPDGRMLVATVSGLILFEPSDRPELTLFNLITKKPGDIRSLGNNDVIHVFTDRKGNTWLSTFGGGLNRLYFENGLPRFEVISTEEGLASNIILSAAEDGDGNIWMATESGLSSYDPARSVVRNYTRYDGVKPTSFSEAACATLDDGSVVFGTYDNVYRVVPGRFGDAARDRRLVLSGLRIDDVRTPFADRIVIPHDCSFFSIDFASLDFSSSGSVPFSYMLEGYDKKWISGSGSNSATYSRIPPGNYVFKVKETYHGDDPADEISIKVRVKPSMWNSILAKVIYVLLGLAVLGLFLRFQYYSMKLRGDVRLEQSLNEIKARFFTNLSHELRTPLTLILGGIDDIRRKTSDGDQNEYSVNLVQKNAKRMLTLVNQLLDTRSIEDGKMKLNVSCFDVVKLVQDVYDDFRDMAVERHMELRTVRSVDSLMIWGDAMRLEALVYNLMTNAFKYTSDGGKIEVGVLYREGDKDFRIMVKDNGIGVAKENSKRIFEPFTKGNVSAFGGMASSGIGLSFCKEITELHHGEIWVDSMSGKGSSFFVKLPMDRERFSPESVVFVGSADDILLNEIHGLSKYKVEPSYKDGALKVLVVEDNTELKIYIYNNLSDKYEVRDASNGKEALQVMASGWTPDMIVTDLMMPEMDGIELVNHIRNDFDTSHIPIIMITAKHEDDTQLKVMKYGADGYIAKPFTMELLLARIDNMLERRKTLVSKLSVAQAVPDVSPGVKKTGKIEFSPEEIVITDKDEQLIKKVMTWLEENVSDPEVTVEQLAAYVGMGRTSMYNKIKGLTGKSPVELIQDFRMEKATYYLRSGQYSVSETSYKVGFSDPGYFSRSFKKHMGMSPADFIKKCKQNNQTI